jgi:hypothetical protein
VVIAGVCALGVTVFALAALRAGGILAADRSSLAESPTPAAAAIAQPAPPATIASTIVQPTAPAASAASASASPSAAHKATPPAKVDPRRASSKRSSQYSPQSL